MDVVKVFVEDPAALGGGDAPSGGGGPALSDDDALGAFLSGLQHPASPYARAYLAGTRLVDGGRPRIGLTAIEGWASWTGPLVAWAAGRTWTQLARSGRATAVAEHEARDALREPAGTLALALAAGPVPADILATVALGDAADSADALRTLLRSDVAVLLPEPAHDGHDWSLTARSPLRGPLVAAFRAHPAGPDVRRFVVPRVRGEARFYFEQWALDALPAGAEEV
jgi:hypothetical protein